MPLARDPDVPPPDAALLARARAAVAFLQLGGIEIDGEYISAPPGDELLAAVVWPESDLLLRLGEVVGA